MSASKTRVQRGMKREEIPSLTLTQQFQIAISKTTAGRQTMPDSSHDIVTIVKKEISIFWSWKQRHSRMPVTFC